MLRNKYFSFSKNIEKGRIKKALMLFGAMMVNGAVFSTTLHATDAQFVIKDIRAEGIERIDIGTILARLPVKVGDTMNVNKADLIIKSLYQTGFFGDVKLTEQNNTLVIHVVERPIIASIDMNGEHQFDHDKMIKALAENGLSQGKTFDRSILEQAILALKSEYYNRGLYSVKITTNVIELKRNRVAITIDVDEGEIATIKQIKFLGNNAFSDYRLHRQMFLTTGNWLSWWYKDNQYSNDKLLGDIEAINTFYLNHGYINFKVKSVQVQLSDDKTNVYITINLAEGDKFTLAKTSIAGNHKEVPTASLVSLLKPLRIGKTVDQSVITKTADTIKNTLGNYGYAFASVNPVPQIDDKLKQVSYDFFIDTGKKVYVRHINITGNNTTRDVIIRRELRQNEASLYNKEQIDRSKTRLNLLGFFDSVNITQSPVNQAIPVNTAINSINVSDSAANSVTKSSTNSPTSPRSPSTSSNGTHSDDSSAGALAGESVVSDGINDQTDLNINVKERDTGSISFGVGYAQGQGLLLNGAISQSNLFGSGKAASLSASTSLISQSLALSFTDPYFLANGTSLGYDLYDRTYTPYKVNISPYQTQTIGGLVRLGIPVSEYDKITFSLGFENNQITLNGNNVPLRFYQFTNYYGNDVNAVPLSVGWVRNTADSTLWPTTGALFNETADMTLPGVGAQYYRFTSQNTWYFALTDNLSWRVNLQAGFIDTYGGGMVPFYQNYYMGGINTVRGYYMSSLGPKDTDGSSFGGTREVSFSNELLIPMPGLKDTHAVRLSAFFDTGSLWGGNSFNLNAEQSFRASYGVGLTWLSPLGSMTFSYALPLFNQSGDILQPFQYLLSTRF